MNAKVSVYGTFEGAEIKLVEKTVSIDDAADVPIKWTVKLLGFVRITIKGRVRVEKTS